MSSYSPSTDLTRQSTHRAETEIWSLPMHENVNVGQNERWASLVGGGLLTLYGITRGSLSGLALAFVGGSLVYRGATGHCNMYASLGLNTAEGEQRQIGVPAQHGSKIETSITINQPRDTVFRFWRSLENLPRFMNHLVSVTALDHKRSHWVARGPMGKTVEWDAEIHNERDGELIAWQSLGGGDVNTAGSVHFEPAAGGTGTVIHVSMKFDPPAGKAGLTIASLLGEDLESSVDEDLRRLKEILETGQASGAHGQSPTHHS